MAQDNLFVVVFGEGADMRRAWDATTDDVEVHFVADERSALALLASSKPPIGCLASAATIPPIDIAAMVRRTAARPEIAAVPWLALASSGVAMDDGAWIDHGVYPDGPFLPPYGPMRAAAAGCAGLVVVHLERLQAITAHRPPATIDDLIRHGWEASLASYISPWLAHVAGAPLRRADARQWSEAQVAIALDAVRRQPTLTVAVRTDGRRPHLLRRCLEALAATAEVSPLQAILVVGEDPAGALAVIDGSAGSVPLQSLVVEKGEVPGRTAAMLAAVDAAATDYLWFVDDDDHPTIEAVRRIRNAVHTDARPVVIGATAAFEEVWEPGGRAPVAVTEVRAHNPYEWYRGFTGWNPIPNCALVVPVESARARFGGVVMRHDLGEDYAVQIALLSAPGTTVSVAPQRIASVSVRPGGDNTITEGDRTRWQRNLSAFLHDLGSDPAATSQLTWQLGAALRSVPPRPWDGTPGDQPPPSPMQRLRWRLLPHRLRTGMSRLRRPTP
jgi:hypothetical protein